MKTMKLMTKEILAKIPPLYSQDGKGDNAIAYAKFFYPYSDWTWYATEYDPQQRLFFGLVRGGFWDELGYFSLDELEQTKDNAGLPCERDMSFKPTTIGEIKKAETRVA